MHHCLRGDGRPCRYMSLFVFQWARDEFEGLFKQSIETSERYFAEPDFIETTRKMDGCKPVLAYSLF